MAITFEQARGIIAAAEGWDPARWGWENDEVYVLVYGADDGEPDLLVDKQTGAYRLSTDDPPAPNLRPVGQWPPDAR